MQTYDDVQIDGNVKTTTKYTCEAANLTYTIIGDNIKEDFKFLDNISSKLDDMLNCLKNASDITNAFYFDIGNGSSVSDITKAYNEIKTDVGLMQTGLTTLHSALIRDIDNVNAELANNFGYWAFTKVKNAGKTTETIEESSSK